jgi:fluoride exporter
MAYLWVALGGALGSMARYGVSGLVARLSGSALPFGTLMVNVTGAALIGIFAGMSAPEGGSLIPVSARLFLMTGICGGYTTFSTFSLETLNLMTDGEWGWALANILASAGICLVAVWLGYAAGLELNRVEGV